MSDSFEINCPQCGRTKKAKVEWIGQKAACSCGAKFVVESPRQDPTPAKRRLPPPPPPKRETDDFPTLETLSPAFDQPRIPKRKRQTGILIVVAAVLFIPLFVLGIVTLFRGGKPSINPVQAVANDRLQKSVNRIIEEDHRNAGVEVSAYYKGIGTKTIVFDVQDVSGSKLDVFRVFLDFAHHNQEETAEFVELAFRGTSRFKIEARIFANWGRSGKSKTRITRYARFPKT